ncbi:MAG: CusA/CzcA family heavy metal efflux RND transporter [Candidatus Eisenbacteria bacterium]
MLEALLRFSIRRRRLVLAAALVLAVLAVFSALRLKLDAFPDTTSVQVQVNTVAPALAPLEIERQITFPLEQALSGLPGLVEVRSTSRFGLSQVTVVFREGTVMAMARQSVSERLQTVELPTGIERPQLGPIATGMGEIYSWIVGGAGRSLSELRTIQDWIVRPQLRSVPGVAEVNSWGGDVRQVHVAVDLSALASRGLTLAELVEGIEANAYNAGGGTFDAAGESRLVQGVGAVTRPEDIGAMAVGLREGVPVLVRDVARVLDGREIRHGAVTADGKGEVVLGIAFLLAGENAHDVTRALRVRLDEVRRTLPAGVTLDTVYDRTTLVDHVLETVRRNLFEGAALVVAVLLVFLGQVRAGLIVAAAIPLSMLFAFDLMVRFGIAGSLMSLGAIDFGLVVDSSVIMVENAVRRLSDSRDGEGGDGGGAAAVSVPDVVERAAIEVRRPTLFGELIILAVYLPILTLEGVEGRLFKPMALTVIFALLGSLVLSLTVVPAACATLLRPRPEHGGTLAARAARAASWYRGALRWCLARPLPLTGTAAMLVLAAALAATRLGSEFVPRLSEGAIVINTVRLAGVSLDESVRYGTRIEQVLRREFPAEVDRVWSRTGSAEVATDPMGTEVSDVFVTLAPREQWRKARTQDELVARMQAALSHLPGMRMVFTQPIELRVNEMVAGTRADVAVKLFGDDFGVLKSKAAEIEAQLRGIRGAADVVTEQLTGQPMLQVELDRAALARHGIPARDVLAVIEALGQRHVGVLHEGEVRVPIVVTLEDADRYDEQRLADALVTSGDGKRVALGELATLKFVDGPSAISREWAKRRIVVQANVRGRDVGGFVAEARRRVHERVELPPGWFVRWGGQFEHLERAQRRLAIVVPAALTAILALLWLSFRRFSDVARIFAAVPFAMVGGVAALLARGLPFSISAAVGFIALSGVAVLNALVLVSTIRQNLAAGMARDEAIAAAADRRLRPVLMTALVASLGFAPMALNVGPGAEVQRPLATVVMGGVLSSTVLTLFVLPLLYGFRRRSEGADGRRD